MKTNNNQNDMANRDKTDSGHVGTIMLFGEPVTYEVKHITDKAEIARRAGLDAYQGHRFRSVGPGCESAFLNALPPEDHIRCLSREGHPGIPWPIVSQALRASGLSVSVSPNTKPTACSADTPPPRKKGWNHSDQVLVYYEGHPEAQVSAKYGIAYYHHKPPFERRGWVDWDNIDRVPSWWWPLPSPPNSPDKREDQS